VEVGDQDHGGDHQDHNQDVVGNGVVGEAELRNRLDDRVSCPRPGDPDRQRGLVYVADRVDAASPLLEVQEELGHDLSEPERDDGEVVAPQAEGGEAQDCAEDRGHDHPYEQHQPEGQVELVVDRRGSELVGGE
jgi:hypothetical protein